jgi:hypothetical protein
MPIHRPTVIEQFGTVYHDAMNSFVQATAIAMPWVRSLTESFATYPPDAATFTKAGGDALGSIATLETSIHC